MLGIRKLAGASKTDWTKHYKTMAETAIDDRLSAFYKSGVTSPDTPISEIDFVALDFETTGLNADMDDIITIGLVPFTIRRIYLKEARHWIVSPNRPLDEESVIIHGITHSQIVDAPDLNKIIEPVLDALSGKVVVAHYRNIERTFLDKALRTRIGEGILFPIVDTLEIESHIRNKESSGFINWLKGKKSPSVRLGRSRERYGLPSYTPHHALTDSIATAELLQAQLAYYYAPDTPIGNLWD